MAQKPTIGLTGGIASGKSSVAALLREQNVAVVDADQLAREVVAPGSEGLRELTAAFGTGIVARDGSLDRQALGALVFDAKDARKQLEDITHPRIARLSAERLAAEQQSDAPYVVYEAALLVETGAHRGLDGLIVVTARPPVQLARMKARDGIDTVDAQKRIDAQFPLEKKVAVADYVIDNDGDQTQLRARALDVHRAIIERFGLSTELA